MYKQNPTVFRAEYEKVPGKLPELYEDLSLMLYCFNRLRAVIL